MCGYAVSICELLFCEFLVVFILPKKFSTLFNIVLGGDSVKTNSVHNVCIEKFR